MSNTHPRAQQCPLCGQHNQCAVAQGLPAEQCWCMAAQISPEALQRIPAAERGQRCICPACGQAGDGQGTAGAGAQTPKLR
ncbi:cysteine-rich CWC family protein [Comamonas odontotermitis]|uniref:cysteine-rich CWC family protein n=1 Tax=Comamonas odontotermitis TaxID=379895 RepID=UPI00161579B8|nr:cysteine-rich CWC family protein [Comamonas odontotermitis]